MAKATIRLGDNLVVIPHIRAVQAHGDDVYVTYGSEDGRDDEVNALKFSTEETAVDLSALETAIDEYYAQTNSEAALVIVDRLRDIASNLSELRSAVGGR